MTIRAPKVTVAELKYLLFIIMVLLEIQMYVFKKKLTSRL